MKKRTRESILPDITPLIDVVFLLLIFFMVSTVFKRDELALLLNLPQSEFGETSEDSSELDLIVLELSTTDIAFNGKKMTFEELEEGLGGISQKETPIDIRIDKSVQYERIVLLFDRLKKHHLSNISLVTERD